MERPNGEFFKIGPGNVQRITGERGYDNTPATQLLGLGCRVLANYDPSGDIPLIAYAPPGKEQDVEFNRQMDKLLLACVPDRECEIVGDADQHNPDNGSYLLAV